MVLMIQILGDDEYRGRVGAGGSEERQYGVSGALVTSEEASACFVLPLREAVSNFAHRQAVQYFF
jgi:hypothetical protein